MIAYKDVLVFDDEGVLKENARLSFRPSTRVIAGTQVRRAALLALRNVSRIRSGEAKD
jgi:hypothetical protein